MGEKKADGGKYMTEKNETVVEIIEPPPNLIPLRNGVLDIADMTLKPYSSEQMFFQKIPWDHDPNATCPEIEEMLGKLVLEDDLPVLMEFVGYCLYRSYPLKNVLLLQYKKTGAKVMLHGLIEALLGSSNVVVTTWEQVIKWHCTKEQMRHKLAVNVAGVPPKPLTSLKTFKILTGEEAVLVRRKKSRYLFRNYAKMIFNSTELPKRSEDIYVLVRLKDFNGSNEYYLRLWQETLAPSEMSGFLNLALGGLKRLLKKERFGGGWK